MVETKAHTEESIRGLLSTINDPEVPAISIVDLGIVRAIEVNDDQVTVVVTPTYSGCPAMKMIEDEIKTVLGENGFSNVSIQTVFAPAWTTDWISETAKGKLKKYGIAPPHTVSLSPLLQIELPAVLCPHCDSSNTKIKSEFGSTSCKAYYFCHSCHQAFEYFKSF